MPVPDPAPPAARPARRDAATPADLLARHAARTGLPLAGLTPNPESHAESARVKPESETLAVTLRLGAGSAAGTLPAAGLGALFGGTGMADPVAAAGWVERLLALSCACEAEADRAAGLEDELEDVTEQLSRGYEELALYHRLTRNLQVTGDPAAFAEGCAGDVLDATGADAAAVRVRLPGGAETFTAGDPLLDPPALAALLRDARGHDWSFPLVRNGPAVPLAGVGGVVVVPVREGGRRSGWVACAVGDGPEDASGVGMGELGSVEASLLGTVATVLATHLRNSALFRDRERMLLEFVLSLVHALDARDHYTKGHSERVAVVAHRLACELGWAGDGLDDLYLSGLLHDIGKVGIEDAVLRKPGKLTEEEFAQIRRHPVIGYDILSGVRGLRAVLPGVRGHHENFDGTGYPDGLAGGDIPPMARVMAVADAYDAMGSDRPYRDGMPVEKIEAILRGGRGTQWDPAVVDAYFACAKDVRAIWDTPGDTAARLAARAKRRVAGA